MKKTRFIFRLAKAFMTRHKRTIIVGFILGIFSYSCLPRFLQVLPKPQKVLKIGVVGRFTLDEIPPFIQEEISSGLTKIAQDGTPLPDLALSWESDQEGKIYTFHLKDNIVWHDGKKLKAEDINYNFKDVEIEVVDEKTIRFKLNQPFSPFLSVVSRPIFKRGLIGTGEYKVKKITRSGHFVETISLRSFDKEKPHLKYRFYPTEGAMKTAFKLGEIDVIEDLLSVGDWNSWPGVKISFKLRQDRFVAVFFNTKDDFLKDKTARQALSYSMKKRSEPERALGPLSPSSWAYNADVKPYKKDIVHAKKLLEQALGSKEDKEINLTISTVPSLLGEAEDIKDEWGELGIKSEIKIFQSDEEFQALLAIQEIPSDPDQYSLWHSTQEDKGNITHLENFRIDKLLEDGRKTQNRKEKGEIYYDFQRFLVEEAPAVFLYYPTTYTISRD